MHPFRAAVEAQEITAVPALLAPDIVFKSPVVHKPYHGRETVGGLLYAVFHVFEDFKYVNEYSSADGRDHALLFSARVGDRQLEGCDFIHDDDAGLISEFTVMVRPLSAAHALRDAMVTKLTELQSTSAPNL
jgi:SnoaL-like protein